MTTPNTQRQGTDRLASRLRARRSAIAERPRLRLAIAAVVLLLLAGLAWPFFKDHLQAVAVLDLVADKPVPGWLRTVASEPVRATELTLPLPSGPVRARLYAPLDHPDAPSLLVLHGVHHLGMNEPRLIAFASAMASCGVRVLTPELPGIEDYHVGPETIATIGDSAAWLATQSSGKPAGVMGLSFSGGLSLLAAADPRWHNAIRFVVAVGSQDEMARVAAYYRTGDAPRPDGTVEYLAPHEYGPLVLEYQNLEDFAPPADIPALRAVLRAHLYEDHPAERAALAALTPAQHTLALDLMSTASPATQQRLRQSELLHTVDAARVSPHGKLGTLTTPVYLLHGEADNIIPAAESQWMAAELPRRSLQTILISPVLSHLDLDGARPTPWDELRLIHFFALVLRAAEAK